MRAQAMSISARARVATLPRLCDDDDTTWQNLGNRTVRPACLYYGRFHFCMANKSINKIWLRGVLKSVELQTTCGYLCDHKSCIESKNILFVSVYMSIYIILSVMQYEHAFRVRSSHMKFMKKKKQTTTTSPPPTNSSFNKMI